MALERDSRLFFLEMRHGLFPQDDIYRRKPSKVGAGASVEFFLRYRLSGTARAASIIFGHSCPKTVLKFRGLGVSFQAQTICPEVVERHLIFACMAAVPKNRFFERQSSYVPVRRPFRAEDGGGVRAEEFSGFEVEKRPPDPWFRSI